MPAETYLEVVIRELHRTKRLADRAIAQLPPDGLFVRLGPGDNSIATIIKHVSGNMLSRWQDFLTADGEKPGRNRDDEFEHLPGDTCEVILARWEQGWAVLFAALARLTEACTQEECSLRHDWQEGDFVAWENTSGLHRAIPTEGITSQPHSAARRAENTSVSASSPTAVDPINCAHR